METQAQTLRSVIRLTKSLADPQRVRALMLLTQGELCVCQIVEVIGLAPSTVSKHLSLLHEAGLVEVRKEGRWAYYRLPEGADAEPVAPALRWLDENLRDDPTIVRDRLVLEHVRSLNLCEVTRQQRRR